MVTIARLSSKKSMERPPRRSGAKLYNALSEFAAIVIKTMKKPSVYLDTSIFSAFWHESPDVSMLARRFHTREWWDLERRHFALWASAFAETELRAGRFPRQPECLKMVKRLRYLPATTAIRDLIEEIVQGRIVPPSKRADAAHLATAAVHGMDFLLTWNYPHMANPVVQRRFEELCGEFSLIAPLMVSPESIPQVRFGQAIRRTR